MLSQCWAVRCADQHRQTVSNSTERPCSIAVCTVVLCVCAHTDPITAVDVWVWRDFMK